MNDDRDDIAKRVFDLEDDVSELQIRNLHSVLRYDRRLAGMLWGILIAQQNLALAMPSENLKVYRKRLEKDLRNRLADLEKADSLDPDSLAVLEGVAGWLALSVEGVRGAEDDVADDLQNALSEEQIRRWLSPPVTKSSDQEEDDG